MIEVQSVNGSYARQHSGLEIDLPVACKVGLMDGRFIAAGGLAWGGGRCWLWFSVEDGTKGILRQTLKECQYMLRKAAQLGATEVFTPRDANYPTSERLCKLAGFEKTGEVIEGKEIWRHLV
jgi:hypothetical protein